MTVPEIIKARSRELSPAQQLEVLNFVDSLHKKSRRTKISKKKPAAKAKRKTIAGLRAALKEVRGIWKDRTDLPADSAEASMELGRRMMRRTGNA